MRFSCAARFAAQILSSLWLLLLAVPVAAQDVTLISRDGSVEVTGNLLGFDGEFYRVDTVYGELTVDGTGVLCDGPGCPDLEAYVAEIGISGAAVAGEVLIPALIEGFARRQGYGATRKQIDSSRVVYVLSETPSGRPVARFTVSSRNSDEGFADLLADEADIVISLREIREAEATRAYEAGMGDMRAANRAQVLALDALVPVTSPGNPLREITVPDLAGVFAGEIANWEELGGPDAPISVLMPDATAGLTQVAEDRLLRPAAAKLGTDIVRRVKGRDLANSVVADPFAIALTTASKLGNTVPLGLSGECGFSIHATRRNAKTEDYPLTAPIFLYTPARRLPRVGREFLAFTRSDPAQLVIRRAGFIDQMPEEVPINAQGDRFANAIARAGTETDLAELQRMVRSLRPLRRLTVSFRFEAGSTELDAQSRSNIAQLAVALESGRYDGRRLVFVGFSDGAGPAAGNRRISERRAESVRDAVAAAAETLDTTRVKLDVEAFGEAMPMACDGSAWGRKANRRVEVWLR